MKNRKKFQKTPTILGLALLLLVAFTSCSPDQVDIESNEAAVTVDEVIETSDVESRSANGAPVITRRQFAVLGLNQTKTFNALTGAVDPDGDRISLVRNSVFGGKPNVVRVRGNRITITRRSKNGSTIFYQVRDRNGNLSNQGRITMRALGPGSF